MTLPLLSFSRTQTYKMSVRCVPQMCCLETKHNSSPSDRRLENKEKGGRGGMNRQKHNMGLQSTKKAVFTLRLKTQEFLITPPPYHCVALTERENSPVKHSVYYSSNSCLKTNML